LLRLHDVKYEVYLLSLTWVFFVFLISLFIEVARGRPQERVANELNINKVNRVYSVSQRFGILSSIIIRLETEVCISIGASVSSQSAVEELAA